MGVGVCAGAVEQSDHAPESTRFLGQHNEVKPRVGAVGGDGLITVLIVRENEI